VTSKSVPFDSDSEVLIDSTNSPTFEAALEGASVVESEGPRWRSLGRLTR